ncbi:MAG: hypothetical protein H6687_02540 [Bacillales bacterium]|nr:hypothetical protein [Bacillales bacterium]
MDNKAVPLVVVTSVGASVGAIVVGVSVVGTIVVGASVTTVVGYSVIVGASVVVSLHPKSAKLNISASNTIA